jgi:hypothetical protein
MHEYTSRNGHRILYMSRAELEGLRGYKASHHGHKARACCPVHDGDNPTALDIDYGKGWGGCYVCGDAFSIRIEDHPDTHRPAAEPGLVSWRAEWAGELIGKYPLVQFWRILAKATQGGVG